MKRFISHLDAGSDVMRMISRCANDAEPVPTRAEVPLPRPVTTVRETIRAVLEEVPQFEDCARFFGLRAGPGEPWTVRDEWEWGRRRRNQISLSLAYFAQLTDIHILVEESPARDITSPSRRRPHGALRCYSTHLLVRPNAPSTFRRRDPHDFVLFTAMSTTSPVHRNALVLECEGNEINPDTGAVYNPLPTGTVTRTTTFMAAGIDSRECPGTFAWAITMHGRGLHGSRQFWLPHGSSATFYFSTPCSHLLFRGSCPNGYCYSDSRTAATCDGRQILPNPASRPTRSALHRLQYSSPRDVSTAGTAGTWIPQENLQAESLLQRWSSGARMPVSLIVLDTTMPARPTKSDTVHRRAQMAWFSESLDHYSIRAAPCGGQPPPADTIADQGPQLVAPFARLPKWCAFVGQGHQPRLSASAGIRAIARDGMEIQTPLYARMASR
jgi:hypothetical protein